MKLSASVFKRKAQLNDTQLKSLAETENYNKKYGITSKADIAYELGATSKVDRELISAIKKHYAVADWAMETLKKKGLIKEIKTHVNGKEVEGFVVTKKGIRLITALKIREKDEYGGKDLQEAYGKHNDETAKEVEY